MVTEPVSDEIMIEKKYESVTGTDSGIVGSLGSTSTWDDSDLDEAQESRDNILLELGMFNSYAAGLCKIVQFPNGINLCILFI